MPTIKTMEQPEETITRYHEGILMELLLYPPPNCNTSWGPEYFFFGATPPSERVIDCIATIKTMRGQCRLAGTG
jgi:hypothetical protein